MREKHTIIVLAFVLFGMLASVPISARGGTEIEEIKLQMQKLILQNKQLVRRVTELEQHIDCQGAQNNEEKKELDVSQQVSSSDEEKYSLAENGVKVSGYIEVEASWKENYDNESSTAFDLEKADFVLSSYLTEWAYGMIGLEWDDKKDKITVDESFILLGKTPSFPGYVQAGRYDVPFGLFKAKTISDSLVEEVFETKENVVLFGLDTGGVTASAYVFNGDTNKGGGKSTLEQYGVSVTYQASLHEMKYSIGVDYINSVLDADGLSGFFPDSLESDYIPGMGGHALVSFKGFGLISEYITAVDTVNGLEPEAWQLEGYYKYMIGDRELVLSLAYSQTDDLAGHLPESRIAAACSLELFKNIGFAMEYTHDKDYEVSDGGTGEGADAFITQLSYEL